MSFGKKHIALISLVVVAVSSFYFFNGAKKKHTGSTFFVNEKHVGEEMSPDEQKLFDQITASNKKIIASFNPQEKELFESLKGKVKSAVSANSKVKIKYKDILTTDEMEIVKKIRKYRKENKIDRKLFGRTVRKLDQEQIMDLMMYVR